MILRPNQEWALDFVSDAISNGGALRALTMVDSYTRECPAIEVDTGISSRQVTCTLERVLAERDALATLRCDNGPEFTSRHFLAWCAQKIELLRTQPGKPMQNEHVESFNGRLRDERLNASWFVNLADAREKIESVQQRYNSNRPYSSLDYQTPAEFAKLCSGLTSGMAALPTPPPVGVGGSHGGARPARSADAVRYGRHCPLRPTAQEGGRDGRSGGMAGVDKIG